MKFRYSRWLNSKAIQQQDVALGYSPFKSPSTPNRKWLRSLQESSDRVTKVSSLEMTPGEEELYSKSININHFNIVKVIGRGSFGKVYLVQKVDTEEFFAMKVLK